MQGDLLCNILLFVAHSLSSFVHASHLKSPDNVGQTADVSPALWVSRLLWMKPVLFPLLWIQWVTESNIVSIIIIIKHNQQHVLLL